MLLGALVALTDDAAWLDELPGRLGVPEVQVSREAVDRGGIRATKVTVRLPDGRHEAPGDITLPRDHPPTVDHHHVEQLGHGEEHRHVGELTAMIEAAPLSEWVKSKAVSAFQLLAEAEGQVHGVAAARVALHEVGALDALIDIVGVVEGFERLGVSRIFHWPVALGGGWVRAAHGELSVPTPATALLMAGLSIRADGPARGEATTPTGAALLRTLSDGPPPSEWRATAAVGVGAGERNPSGYANVLRLLLAEPVDEAEEIVVLATDLDDLNPEYLEPLRAAMVDAGAADVQVWSTMGKKGRISFRVEAIVPEDRRDDVADALLRHSTSGGCRWWRASRSTLERHTVTRSIGDGPAVRVKVFEAPDGLREKPELDDLQALARSEGRPVHRLARELQDHAARHADSSGSRDPTTSTSQE